MRLLLCLCITLLGCSQESEPIHGESYSYVFDNAIARGFNGNVLVSEGNGVVFQGAYGLANPATGDSLHLNTQFRLASVSKHFTALGILALVDSGRISLNDELQKYVPELPYEGITITHLLHHTSGLPDYVTLLDEVWKPELADSDKARFISGNEDIVRLLAKHKPPISFDPGEQWEYSNTGYVLLATIIERVSGTAFPEYLQANLFVPAGLSNTLVFDPISESPMAHRAFGYYDGSRGIISSDIHFLNPARGDGGIYSTLEDLLKWNDYLHDQEIIAPALLDLAYTSGKLNNGEQTRYGFGWGIGKSPSGSKVVMHSGGWVGFSTYYYRDLVTKGCIIILTNNSSDLVQPVLDATMRVMYAQ